MKATVLVGSKSNGTLVVVDGIGLTQVDVQRNAVNTARALHHIVDPVALIDNHESARIVRLDAEKKQRELIGSMRQNSKAPIPFYRQPEPRGAMYAS